MSQWIPLKEYAELKGVSKQAIDKQIKTGTIPEDHVCYKLATCTRGKRMIRHIKMED